MGLLNIVWSLLNLGLFISLLIGLFTGFKPLRERFGPLGAILPLALLVAMCQSSDKQSTHPSRPEPFRAITIQHNAPINSSLGRSCYPLLEDLTTFVIRQHILFTRLHQSDSIQIYSNSLISGFVAGFHWRPTDTQVNFLSADKVRYHTVGTLEWQLLGLPIFKQRKQFDGYVNLSETGFM